MIGFQRDRASTNTAAVKVLLPMVIGSKDFECVSHTNNNNYERWKTIETEVLVQDLCSLIKESYGASRHWYGHMGKEFRQPGQTRWWAMVQNVFSFCFTNVLTTL